MWLVIIIRLLFPTIILKYPLFGGLLAIILDYFDLNLLTALDPNSLHLYQSMDKILDYYYLSLEAVIALTWKNKFVKYLTFGLFAHRAVGIVLFEIFHNQALLFYFPNVFEWYFLASLLLRKFSLSFVQTKRAIIALLITLLIPKLAHEYLLHINKVHPWSKNPYVAMLLQPQIEALSFEK